MLLDAAQQAGASAYCGTRLHTCESVPEGGWELSFANDSSAGVPIHRFRATAVIDATGRAAAFARRQHARRLNTDRLIGLSMVSDAHESGAEDDSCGGCTLIEACVDGWWYSALLPDRRLIAVYMTDADFVPQPRDWRSFWHARLDQTVHTRGRLAGRRVPGPARLVAASTSRLDRTGGACWLAAGDAVAALDPLSSQGLVHALSSGVQAAEAVDHQLAGDGTAVDAYTLAIDRVLHEYSRLRARYYGRERRWPQSRFWQRRHAIAA